MSVHAAQTSSSHKSPPAAISTEKKTVRLMTYNIHHGRGTDGKYDLSRIARVIEAANPEIVALQEIEQFRLRTHRDDQPALLAEKLGMNLAFARVRTHCLRDSHHHASFGNAILTRFPILAEEHFSLTYANTLEPRGCLHVTVDAGGRPLHVFCVHLGLRYRERHYQMERLLSEDIVHSPRFGEGPKVLMGDFNNWWPVKSARGMHPHFENACIVTGRRRHGTFNKYFDVLCLDYIFASNELKVESFEVLKNGAAKVASDHRPVVCSVSFNNGDGGTVLP
ncbi:MAG: endonuclease/exonuclease/phosphatase family protein [Candidatus Sumerlaeaceae bacterium]